MVIRYVPLAGRTPNNDGLFLGTGSGADTSTAQCRRMVVDNVSRSLPRTLVLEKGQIVRAQHIDQIVTISTNLTELQPHRPNRLDGR